MKNAYLGHKAPRDGSWQRRRIYEAINEVALMEVYGGYEALLAAPHWHVTRTSLVLIGRTQAEQEETERAGNDGTGGGSRGSRGGSDDDGMYDGGGGSSPYDAGIPSAGGARSTYVGRTYTSRYEPE